MSRNHLLLLLFRLVHAHGLGADGGWLSGKGRVHSWALLDCGHFFFPAMMQCDGMGGVEEGLKIRI
jgi:hypothetical protein